MAKAPKSYSPNRALAVARREALMERKDEIFELYMSGHSFEQIVGMLKMTESPNYVRSTLHMYAYEDYVVATRARSHALVEKAVDVARQAISIGDSGGYRVATDVFLKVAGKLNREDYGDKGSMEVTGKGGGPIAMAAATLTDEQLMELIAKSKHQMEAEE
jgi:hypothetical protein